MSGAIGLHGGGEYLAGDEPFLDALLVAAARAVAEREAGQQAANPPPDEDDVEGHRLATTGAGQDRSSAPAIRIVVLPTAAARGLPDRAASRSLASSTAGPPRTESWSTGSPRRTSSISPAAIRT